MDSSEDEALFMTQSSTNTDISAEIECELALKLLFHMNELLTRMIVSTIYSAPFYPFP